MIRAKNPERIILTGFMGTGKTAIGEEIARELGFEFIDTDRMIEAEKKMPISEIFAKEGEPAFRVIEKEMLKKALGRPKAVIATGGGAIIDPDNLKLMRENGVVVALQADPEVILARVQHLTNRPLLEVEDKLEKIKELLSERSPYYKKADIVIDTSRKGVEEVAEEIVDKVYEKD